MRKVYFSLLTAMSICACTNKHVSDMTTATDTTIVETAEKDNYEPHIQWQDSSFTAVANIGYNKELNAIKESDKFKRLAEHLPQLKEIDEIAVNAQGEELYLIVPRDKCAKVTVYEYTFEMAAKEKPEKSGMVYYKSESGKPFIVKGNISDICPNMQIEIVNSNGESYTFSPSMSLENGKLYIQKGMQELE